MYDGKNMFTEEQTKDLVNKAKTLAFEKLKQNDFKYVKVICNQLLKVVENDTDGLQFLGICEFNEGNYEEAKTYFQKILDVKNTINDVENVNNLALCYGNLGDHNTAIDYLQRCREFVKNNDHLDSNLLLQYRFAGKTDKAIEFLHKKLEENPNNHKDLAFLGGCYAELNQYELALKYLHQALDINPDFHYAKIDLASIYQLLGDSDKAWVYYESRFDVYEQCKYWSKLFDQSKRWDGKADLNGKRIILHSEQGAGDIIHFSRYCKLIKQKGATVILHCWESMKNLLSHLADEIYATEPVIKMPMIFGYPDLPPYDYVAPLMSVPHLIGKHEIPNEKYITSEKKLDFSAYENFYKIGICWAGTPAHPNDFHRSVKLELFKNISKIPNVKLFSLTKDTRPRKHKFHNKEIDLTENAQDISMVDMTEFMNTYDDTASIISEMDLVITVDTSVLHIAGALHHPTLALIPHNPDWRWGLKGESTKWYPSVKLFRNTYKDNWKKVFEDLKTEVEQRSIKKNKIL